MKSFQGKILFILKAFVRKLKWFYEVSVFKSLQTCPEGILYFKSL